MVKKIVIALVTLSPISLALSPAFAKPPKLAVLIVVDQLPNDLLDRHREHLTGGGFSELMSNGARFHRAFYRHSATATGPGHALLGSGQYGAVTGIVGNEWIDAAAGRAVYCVEDPAVAASTPTARPMSPRNFQGRALAQRVKAKYPKSRVVAVSLKDRSAILAVGGGADGAYWFDPKAGQFVSSSYYPYDPRALAFNAELPAFLAAHSTWTWSLGVATRAVCPQDDSRYHRRGLGLGFPHPVRSLQDLTRSPFGNDLLGRFAEHVSKVYSLGQNPAGSPDVLVVSFSAFDYVGHAYGPDSCEVADATARLDATLNRLLQWLQSLAPAPELAVVLSADHGAASIPELVRAAGGDAGRVNLYDEGDRPGLAGMAPLRRGLEQAVAAAFGYEIGEQGPFLIAGFGEPCLYLDPAGPARGREAQSRYWLKGFLGGQEGVQSVHTREDIEAKKAPESLRLSWRPDRGGDVCVILKPNWIWASDPEGTSHGQPHPHDSHVPVLVWGRGVRPGDHHGQVSPAQVAPTLARFLELPLDGFAEKPLPGLFPDKDQGQGTRDKGKRKPK